MKKVTLVIPGLLLLSQMGFSQKKDPLALYKINFKNPPPWSKVHSWGGIRCRAPFLKMGSLNTSKKDLISIS